MSRTIRYPPWQGWLRPILMTYAQFEEEENSPRRNYEPLRAALRNAGAALVETRVFATDHGYSEKRIALSQTLVEWLARVGGPWK